MYTQANSRVEGNRGRVSFFTTQARVTLGIVAARLSKARFLQEFQCCCVNFFYVNLRILSFHQNFFNLASFSFVGVDVV